MAEIQYSQIMSEYFTDFMVISSANVVPSVCVSVTKNTGHTVYKYYTAVLVF
jgi:hypothetical protein